MEQLLAHFWGDFVVQNDWMALNKKKPGLAGWIPVLAHALTYAVFFAVLVTTSWKALAVICVTHAIIDHYDFVPRIVWARNWMAPRWIKYEVKVEGSSEDPATCTVRNFPWSSASGNFGFSPGRPQFLTIWLYIIIDNVLHLTINYAAIRWL